MRIEVVYVVNPSFEIALFNSIRSLILSKSTFDQISIYCVGNAPKYWKLQDPRISVIEVSDIFPNFFLANKTYALRSKADLLIYLDADTLVLRPIEIIYQNCTADFMGKQDSLLEEANRQEYWNSILRTRNLKPSPYFNSGFFIVRNNLQSALFEAWKSEIEHQLSNQSEVISLHERVGYSQELCRHFSEQIALSLALSVTASCETMEDHHHAFGWQEATDEEVIVYHTGSPHYYRLSMSLQRKYNFFNKNLPKQFSSFNPIYQKRLKNRLRFGLSKLINKLFLW